MQPKVSKDERIYTNFNHLVKFKYLPSLFSLTPYKNGAGLMSGRHLSKFRGRGLNFEEFRHYHEGDDIRAIDWRVTLRSRKPHVRVYSEEKELPVILLVDQRKSMFFSSQQVMKSVVASELAALCLWQVLKDSDRVGCLVFNDQTHNWFTPQRGMTNALRIAQSISDYNQSLSVNLSSTSDTRESLSRGVFNVQNRNVKGALIIVFSDFVGFDDEIKAQFQSLQQFNDVLAVSIKDPLEAIIAPDDSFYASDGSSQVNLIHPSKPLLNKYQQYNQYQHRKIQHTFAAGLAPFIEISTEGDHLLAMQRAILRRR